MNFVRETRGGRSVESVGGGAIGGWRRWWVAPVSEWLRSMGGAGRWVVPPGFGIEGMG